MSRAFTRRQVLAAAAGAMLGFGACQKQETASDKPELVLRYAENQPEDYPTTQAALAFGNLLEEQTGGRVKVAVYSKGELGAEMSVIQQIQFGGIDFARVSLSQLAEYMPALNGLQLPFLYQDAGQMWRVLDGSIGDEFLTRLDAIDLSKYKNQQGVSSIYEDYSPAQMNQLMVSKQADLVMLMRIMPDLFDAETRRKNFMFYESRTLHDSSLSHGQHCVLAAWEGLDDMALDMYRHAIAIDLGPNMKSSDLGIHSASMGNVWQCVVCGFAGLEWHEGGLSLRSHLPASWQRAAFNIVWRGAKLHVEVTHAGITVTHRGGSAVEITVDGHPVKLAAE